MNSLDHLLNAFKHIGGAVVVADLNGIVRFWNPSAESLFGFSAQEMLGACLWDRYPSAVRERMKAEAHSLLLKKYFSGKFQGIHRDGRMIWIDLQVNLLTGDQGEPLGFMAVSHDVTAQKHVELHRAETGLQLEAIIHSLDDAIISIDEMLRVAFANKAAEEAFDCRRDELLNRNADEFPRLNEVLNHLNLREMFAAPGTRKAVRRIEGAFPDGEAYAFDATVASVRINNKIFCTAVIRDASQQKQIEHVLFQSQKMQAIGALASGVAHDFNNILTAILSHLDLVSCSPDLPASFQEPLARVKVSARRGAELVSKLITFSRQSEPKMTLVNLADLGEEVVFMLRRSIDRRIQVNLAALSREIWPVQADSGQLMQVILNLALNARDAMPNGGELTINLDTVNILPLEARPPRKSGDFVKLTVKDTGEGIRPEILSRMFEPYFTTRNIGRGTGLGLSIAQSVVMDHGGWIEVESVIGQGSQFHAYLPRAIGVSQAKEVRKDLLPSENQALEGKETILVVDDEDVVRLVVRAILSYRGYQVEEAVDGEEAIAKCQAPGASFDLILLDLNMPKLSGWDTLSRIQKINNRIPVILLSGGSAESVAERVDEVGAAGMIAKPFENVELLRLLRTTLDRARQNA